MAHQALTTAAGHWTQVMVLKLALALASFLS